MDKLGRLEVEQLKVTSTTPPADSGLYKIDETTMGVVGDLKFRHPKTGAMSSALTATTSAQGSVFSGQLVPDGIDTLIGGRRPARNAVPRDPMRGGVIAVDYADAPLATANCTTAPADLPAIDNGCAARKSTASGRRIVTTNASSAQIAYQPSAAAKTCVADTLQLWIYFEDRSTWLDASYVYVNISDGWTSGAPSGNVINASRQLARHPGWHCIEFKKTDFTVGAGVAASAWSAPNYVRAYFTAGQAVGSTLILDQLRWAVSGKPLIALSLDNSYENQFAAAEIMSRYGLVGNFSAVPDRFATNTGGLQRMSAGHMRDLIAMGHRPIQHTYNTVAALGGLEAWKTRVVADTKAWQDLGIDADVDCVLFLQGDYTSTTYGRELADWAQQAGFAVACASSGGGFVGSAGYRRWQMPRYEMQGPSLNSATVLSDLDVIISKGGAVVTKTHHVLPIAANASETTVATFDAICSGIADRVNAGAVVNCSLRDLALRRA